MFVVVIFAKKPNGVFAHRFLYLEIYENKLLVKVILFRIFCYHTRFKTLYCVPPSLKDRDSHTHTLFYIIVRFKLKIKLFKCFQRTVNTFLGIPKFSSEYATGDRCRGTEKDSLSVRKYKK